MKVYVASSWRNVMQTAVVRLLQKAGHEVYDFRKAREGYRSVPTGDMTDHGFRWSDIDVDWKLWKASELRERLEHPIAVEGFNRDMLALTAAHCCVLVLPCGRSAHLEAGFAVGAGKPVIIYNPDAIQLEPELMYKMCYRLTVTEQELIDALTSAKFDMGMVQTGFYIPPKAHGATGKVGE